MDAEDEPLMKTSTKGKEALFVAFTLERWLRNCPRGPLQIGPRGGDAISSLVCGWSATVIHALAAQPLTLPELHRAVEILSFETVEEHVEAMERVGQVEEQPGKGGHTLYAVTDWLREGLAPLAAAARMECRYPEEGMAPPDTLDVEATFQLPLPLLKLPADLTGSCRLGVQIPGGPPLLAGAMVRVERGRVVSSSPLLEDEEVETFATGSPLDWLDTLADPSAGRIKAGGDTRLADALIEGLHEVLFGVQVLQES
jgi:DNA-binding HxlR family transcriptional regulator